MNHGRSFWILAHMFRSIWAQTRIAKIRQRGRYVRSARLGSRYRHWNTKVAVECAVYWHLLGLSFSFPNWLESHDVRRHRSLLLPSPFWPISCSPFAPRTLGGALGLRKQDLE